MTNERLGDRVKTVRAFAGGQSFVVGNRITYEAVCARVLDEWGEIYPDEDKLIFTADTIDDFLDSRLRWREPGIVELNEDGALLISRCQAVKGQTRRDLYVLDFGDQRVSFWG